LKLTTDRYEASRSLFATAELLVLYTVDPLLTYLVFLVLAYLQVRLL